MHDASPSMHTSECPPCRSQATLRFGVTAAPACLPAAHRVFCLSAICICCSRYGNPDTGILQKGNSKGVSVRVQSHPVCCMTAVCAVNVCTLAAK